MKKAIATMVVAAFGFATVVPAFAAEGVVTSVSGSVMVRQGGQFVPAVGGMKVADGDIVSALEKGAATVAYDNRCSATVASGETAVVGAALCPPTTTGQAEVVGGAGLLSGIGTPVVVGGVLVVGGVATAVAVSQANKGASN